MEQDFSPHFPQSIDNTMATCYFSCGQKFFNEYCVRISPTGISPDLHAGGALAQGFETTRYALYAKGKTLIEALAEAYITFTQYWGMYQPPNSNPKTYIATFCALVDYFREYPPFEDGLPPYFSSDGKPALEFTFGIPLPLKHPETGDPILYSGRFDMLAEISPGTLCVVDEKSTKSFFKNWEDQWKMRGQFFGYVWAAQQYGLSCEHFCVRGIAIQRTQYQHKQYGPVKIAKWQLDDWYRNMIKKVEGMIKCWHTMTRKPTTNPHDHWERSYGEACSVYGGCSYLGLCTQQDPRRWYYDFQRRVWDPLKKNPTEGSEQPLLDLAGKTMEQLGAVL